MDCNLYQLKVSDLYTREKNIKFLLIIILRSSDFYEYKY